MEYYYGVEPQTACSNCKANISETDFFCPACGKQLKEKPLSVAWSKQLFIYLVSFFLPPLGLWPAWKYLKSTDKKFKTIGIAAVVLTVISILISVYLSAKILNEINTQMKVYRDLGM